MIQFLFYFCSLFVLLPTVSSAQLWREIYAKEMNEPGDSGSFGIEIKVSNLLTHGKSFDHTADNTVKNLYFNPMFEMEIGYDIRGTSSSKNRFFVGWDSRFHPEHLVTRLKVGYLRDVYAFGIMIGRHAVMDPKGIISTRFGFYRIDPTYGVIVQYDDDKTHISASVEHSAKRAYHKTMIERKLMFHESFWIGFKSESLYGYGPKIVYKSKNCLNQIFFSLNMISGDEDGENIKNSFEVGVKKIIL